MKRKRRYRSALAVLLAAVFLFSTSLDSISVNAENGETADASLCEHHKEHTEDCGGIEGACTYECSICDEQGETQMDAEQTEDTADDSDTEETTAVDENADENMDESTDTPEAVDEDTAKTSGETTTPAVISGVGTPKDWIGNYTVDGVSPSNATINVFDYWLHSQSAADNYKVTTGNNANNVHDDRPAAHWWRSDFLGENSINRDGKTIHPFVFAGIAQSDNYRFGIDGFNYEGGSSTAWGGNDDGHAAWRYNTYVNPGNGAFQGILQSTLQEGYPALNLSTEQVKGAFKELEESNPNYKLSEIPDELKVGNGKESLKYLFDPDEEHKGKASYANATGLLQQDDNGYYYYDSTKNFAELDTETKEFYLFDKPGLFSGASGGQFFPFNSAADVFNDNGTELTSKKINRLDPNVNHYFGLTLEVDFYQPDGGKVSTDESNTKEDMIFRFSGDDDVWVFIDGVLVADLGGIHDAMEFEINFATGAVTYKNRNMTSQNTSLREQFLKAIEENGGTLTDSQGNTIDASTIDTYFRKIGNGDEGTFRSGTEHTLQFYYLERGNQESNMKLSYNLVPPIADDVVKLDQNNKPIKDVEFKLYKADKNYKITADQPIADFTTDENGEWTMVDENKIRYDFGEYAANGTTHYVMREVSTKEGYRKVPDIHLEYSKKFNILEVANTWDTGAVGNFTAKIYQSGDLIYQNPSDESDATISSEDAKAGIVLAVPLAKTNAKSSQADAEGWRPIYGANLEGFASAEIDEPTDNGTLDMRKRVLKAALYQVHASETDSDKYQSWHLSWSEEEDRYQGTLNDLPGTPDRYYLTEADSLTADLAMSYYFVDSDAFTEGESDDASKLGSLNRRVLAKLGGAVSTDEDYLEKLDAAIDKVADELLGDFAQVNLSNFKRLYGSHIYIPNSLNTLSVRKLDENDQPMEGVEFTIYDSDKKALKTGETDANGSILFSATAQEESAKGQVQIALEGNADTSPETAKVAYYIRETKGKDGYVLNNSWIPVYVTDAGVYADALEKDDNILVYSGLGQLLGTMTRYATNDGVNVTLRDLTLQGNENTKTENGKTTLNVHYKLKNAVIDYGNHEGIAPVFVTDEGIGYGQVRQNYSAHSSEEDEYYTGAVKFDLGDQELSHLFTGSTTIVVRNEPEAGHLKVSKTVSGDAGDKTKEFSFTVTLSDETVNGKYGDMTFENGVANIKLKHGESATAKWLPLNVTYTVAESDNEGYTVTSTGETGEIKLHETAEAQFNNHKDSPEDPKDSEDPKDPDSPSTTTKTEQGPKTGDTSNIGLWLLLWAASGIAVFAGFVVWNQRRKRIK